MTREDALAFAKVWIGNWNNRDLDAILSHYTEAAEFRSPKALAIVGMPTLSGRAAMESYWRAGLGRIEQLHFTLDHALWDDERRALLIVYVAAINDQRTRACELFRFDASGKVSAGEAMYGIPA